MVHAVTNLLPAFVAYNDSFYQAHIVPMNCAGLKRYGMIGVITAAIGFIAFYVGLKPFDHQPSIEKVLVEGVIYYIGVAIIEELYVRGLLLNLIEKIFYKKQNSTLTAVILSSAIFGLGHIFGTLNQPLLVI